MKAIVLCAGLGLRLGGLTRETLKPMLKLHGQPLLAYILRQLKCHGFNDVVVEVHSEAKVIRQHFGYGAGVELGLTHCADEQFLNTAGARKRMEEVFLGEPDFLVRCGDVLTDQDLSAMVRFHRARRRMATLLVHARARSNSVASLDPESRLVGFLKCPAEAEQRAQASAWLNSGVCLCSPEVFATMPREPPLDLPRGVFPRLLNTGRVLGFPLTRYRCAFDSAGRLGEARLALPEGRRHTRHLARRIGANDSLVTPVSAASRHLEHVPRHTTLDTTRTRRELGLAFPDPLRTIEETFPL